MTNRWDTDRTEAFSDGVFAIAITLLVLDLQVPATALNHLWHGIAHEWPEYLGYATSFITIGGIWLAHHRIFRHLRYANRRVMQINLLLLMAVAFLPFPTRLLAEAIRDVSAERTAVIFYGASLLVISLVLGALWRTVVRDRELLKPDVSERQITAISRASAPNVGLYLAVTAIALVSPHAAAFGYLLIALFGFLRARGEDAIEGPASS